MVLHELGTENIADRHESLLEDLSIEEIILADPDHIFITTMGDESAALANYTSELMATRLSDAMWIIEQVMWKSLDKRVAAFLLEEVEIEGVKTLNSTHETIGNHLGSQREVITRMLRYFQNEGMVKLSRGTVEIVDVERLKKIEDK